MAEELHFGHAALRLYISQPSLSHQIRKLEEALETPLFVRSSRRVQLTAAGRALLQEAPKALAALEQAVQRTRLAGSGIATTIRLGYTPVANFGTIAMLLDALQEDHPDLMIDAREVFSAEIPERVCAGDLDIGLALSPQPMDGVDGEVLRKEPVSALLSTRHRLADEADLPLKTLHDETLLLFPRRLAPAYYDSIIAACEDAGFTPEICAFEDPPVNPMLARLSGGREVGLAPRSFAENAAKVGTGVVARGVVEPTITAELSVLWPTNDQSPAIESVLATARRCAAANGWLRGAEA